MRVIGEIPHPQFKITLFSWNGKYLIKLEAGMYEQTYKIREDDLSSEAEIHGILNEGFLARALEAFRLMHSNLQENLPG
jgi:hypothetical protein